MAGRGLDFFSDAFWNSCAGGRRARVPWAAARARSCSVRGLAAHLTAPAPRRGATLGAGSASLPSSSPPSRRAGGEALLASRVAARRARRARGGIPRPSSEARYGASRSRGAIARGARPARGGARRVIPNDRARAKGPAPRGRGEARWPSSFRFFPLLVALGSGLAFRGAQDEAFRHEDHRLGRRVCRFGRPARCSRGSRAGAAGVGPTLSGAASETPSSAGKNPRCFSHTRSF